MIFTHHRNHTPKVLIALGTRPELIKLAPLIARIENSGTRSNFLVVSTSQHTELLKDQFEFWGVQPDITLPSGLVPGNLTRMLAASLNGLQDVIDQYPSIEYVLVQGDTNTALTCAHLAFLNQKKLVHVEAGLRTHDLQSPFPEEYNRMMVSKAAYFHFVPSEKNRLNLLQEGCLDEHIMVTGNTVIDALHTGFAKAGITMLPQKLRREVIITLHRRENADSFRQLIKVVSELSAALPELDFKWITHPNYTIENRALLQAAEGISIIEHLPYMEFISLYTSARFVITDSGGITEEVSQLGIPVVVFRKLNDRSEPMEMGHAMIVCMEQEEIAAFFNRHLHSKTTEHEYFGTGKASEMIFDWIAAQLESSDVPERTDNRHHTL